MPTFIKNASVIQTAMDGLIAEMSSRERLVPLILERACRHQLLTLTPHEIERLSSALLHAQGSVIQVDLDLPCSLGETEEEAQETLRRLLEGLPDATTATVTAMTDAISQTVPETIADVARTIGDALFDQAHAHALEFQRAQAERVDAVQCLWGAAIDQLDMLRHLVMEWSHSALLLRRGRYNNFNTAFALDKLVTRASDLTGEIITLARNAYADGALARWRTLHEVCVVAMFLARESDLCAEMYLSHHKFDELRLLKVDKVSGAVPADDVYGGRYVRGLQMRKAAMVHRYGAAIENDYGWAAIELGRSKVSFRDLELHVGLETLRRGYKQANNAVHGGALAALTRISLGVGSGDASEFPASYGCEVSVNYAAASLSMLIAELCLDSANADLLAMNLMIQRCGTDIMQKVRKGRARISVNSPRAKILRRKAAEREQRLARLQGNTKARGRFQSGRSLPTAGRSRLVGRPL